MYKWYHVVFVFLWFTSLNMIISRFINVVVFVLFCLFLGGIQFNQSPPSGSKMLYIYLINNAYVYTHICVYTHTHTHTHTRICILGFPGGSDSKESAYNAGNLGSIPGLRRSPGEGHGNPLQYSCLGNSMSRGAWRATVSGVAESQTWLSN